MYTNLTPLHKFFSVKSVRIYDVAFLLHSKCTTAFLLAFSILLSVKQFFGEPIKCYTEFRGTEFMNSYCWTMGTYIVQNLTRSHAADVGIGLGPNKIDHVYLRYYQWVASVLTLQAIAFYIPAFLWKIWENNRMRHLCANINEALIPDKVYEERIGMLMHYFSRNLSSIHTVYMMKFIFCEVLNLVISLINFYILNIFLNNLWWNYIEVYKSLYQYDWDTWNELTSQLFPKMAKCHLTMFGATATKENRDALCLLPLNILNEKIFAFLWAWFVFIGCVAAIKLILRLLMLCFYKVRVQILRIRLHSMTRYQVAKVLECRSIGDWFIFIRLSENINESLFEDLMKKLSNSHKYNTKSDV